MNDSVDTTLAKWIIVVEKEVALRNARGSYSAVLTVIGYISFIGFVNVLAHTDLPRDHDHG